MLAIIVPRAKEDGHMKGVVPHLVEDGLSILRYANDNIIFMDPDFDQGRNMKLIVCTFEQLLGLKINFHKCEIFCFGLAEECEAQYSQLFGCKVGSFPLCYLEIPMHFTKLNTKDRKEIENRIEKRPNSCKGKKLSLEGD
jgi:hypothetical protein